MNRIFVAGFLAVALATQLPIATTAQEPPAAPADPTVTGEGRIMGRVMGTDKSPVRGAKVMAFHLSSAQTYSSAETGSDGHFEIANLPYGYFDIAVSGPDGLFVANEVVNVPPSGKLSLSMTLLPGGAAGAEPRAFAGLEQTPSGIAEVGARKTGGQFWSSAAGIAILGGIGGATLLALALSGGDDETPVSPTNP